MKFRLLSILPAILLLGCMAGRTHAQTPTDTLNIRRVAIDVVKPRTPPPGQRIVLDRMERPFNPKDTARARTVGANDDLTSRIGGKLATDAERLNCTAGACKLLPTNVLLVWVNQPHIKGDSASIVVGRANTTVAPACPARTPPAADGSPAFRPGSPGSPACGTFVSQLNYLLTIVRADNVWRVVKVTVATD